MRLLEWNQLAVMFIWTDETSGLEPFICEEILYFWVFFIRLYLISTSGTVSCTLSSILYTFSSCCLYRRALFRFGTYEVKLFQTQFGIGTYQLWTNTISAQLLDWNLVGVHSFSKKKTSGLEHNFSSRNSSFLSFWLAVTYIPPPPYVSFTFIRYLCVLGGYLRIGVTYQHNLTNSWTPKGVGQL